MRISYEARRKLFCRGGSRARLCSLHKAGQKRKLNESRGTGRGYLKGSGAGCCLMRIVLLNRETGVKDLQFVRHLPHLS